MGFFGIRSDYLTQRQFFISHREYLSRTDLTDLTDFLVAHMSPQVELKSFSVLFSLCEINILPLCEIWFLAEGLLVAGVVRSLGCYGDVVRMVLGDTSRCYPYELSLSELGKVLGTHVSHT